MQTNAGSLVGWVESFDRLRTGSAKPSGCRWAERSWDALRLTPAYAALCLFILLIGVSIDCIAQEETPLTRAALAKVADQSTVVLTTIGRKSGKPHTTTIWFVYDNGRFYLQSGKGGKTDWYRNLKHNPRMTLQVGAMQFAGEAQFITDAKETERIHTLFRQKYLTARLLGAVGSSIGYGEVLEVKLPF